MTKQPIPSMDNNPEWTDEHSPSLPEGAWQGELVWLAWGRNKNLFCYFRDVNTGERYRAAVFWRDNETSYCPRNGGPSMRNQSLGTIFDITSGLNSRSRPILMTAKAIV